MRTIRASEIGSYCYCQRAWWYQLQGYASDNQAELTGGSDLHEQHGRAVLLAGCFNTIAYALLILAVLAITIWLVGQVL